MTRTKKRLLTVALSACAASAALATSALPAQEPLPRKVELSFNRFYDFEQLTEALNDLVRAYPNLLTIRSIGKSTEGRDIWLVTINNPATGEDRDKPGMYIDGNVHGNEVQASEVCLYTIWYLTKSYGVVDKLTRLVDERAFYIVPSVNPDGRAYWFREPNTSSSARSGMKPTDDDYDGLYDEDGPDDLDGDGHITTMWKADPNGRWRRSPRDPRIFERVAADETGEYTMLGEEGIDNDGDGRINEDDPGGYDMNRNWPSGWQPNHVQYGAGEYPFSYPEPAAVGAFILDHPNIAAVQSYHNAGGMMLRGPGVESRESFYPREDLAVYDEIGQTGERMLPFYRYLVIWKDLYEVHGGFVNWTAEGLGVFSFTNELWNADQYFQGKEGDWQRRDARMRFGDLLEFEHHFVPYKPHQHPFYGEVLIGGWTKFASRVSPAFMLDELCHRNFAFTMYHADQMPKLSFSRVRVKPLAPATWEVTVEVTNERLIPTISGVAAQKRIGARDAVELTRTPGADPAEAPRVVASGAVGGWFDAAMSPTEHQPHRIWADRGVPGRGQRLFRWIVSGEGEVEITYRSQKAGVIRRVVALVEQDTP